MPTNRNNNEVSQSFAIGTKIEYMNKLFEVVESNSCCDCSIASICSSSDLSASDRNDDILSRDKRINIFGECSSVRRPDSKSIVFAEIPKEHSKDTSKDKYHKIIPLWRVDNPSKLKSVEFDLPNGYVIDKENSDLDKGIIRFKRKWLTIEEMYNLKPIVASEFLAPSVAVNESTRNKIVAIITLMDIARYFNGDWKYDPTKKDEVGYMICYDKFAKVPYYYSQNINSNTDVYYGNVIFKNEADAQYVIDNPNFKDILDAIFKV